MNWFSCECVYAACEYVLFLLHPLHSISSIVNNTTVNNQNKSTEHTRTIAARIKTKIHNNTNQRKTLRALSTNKSIIFVVVENSHLVMVMVVKSLSTHSQRTEQLCVQQNNDKRDQTQLGSSFT